MYPVFKRIQFFLVEDVISFGIFDNLLKGRLIVYVIPEEAQ